jgi:asparagine synthase (glutamine-hydrolysing)
MAVFAFALAFEHGQPLHLQGARALRPGLAAPSMPHERSGEGWHAAWRNAATGPQTDFAIGANDIVAIVTARLDGREALRTSLGLDRDGGDATLLLAAHGRWGEAMLDHLRGDFAFVLWDASRGRLIAARDQIGASPLFYREHDGVLLVGTAFDAIRDHDRAGLSLSDMFIGDLLLRGTPSRHETSIYNEISRVPAAHALHVAGGRTEVRRYWSFPAYGDPLILRSRGEYAEAFYATLRDSVAERLPETGPVVVLMSGGLDSTAVAAAAADILGAGGERSRITAYTTVFRSDPEQEGDYAALVARQLGIAHHCIEAEDYLTRPLAETQEWIPPEPGAVAARLPESCASETAEAGGGTLLTGMGPDVYLRMPGTDFWHMAHRGFRGLPDAVRHARALGRLPGFRVRASLGRLRRRLFQNPAPGAPAVPAWIDTGFARRSGLAERLAARRAADRELRAALLTSPFWPAILSSGHPAMAGRALLPGHPFLSLSLIELAVRLPLHTVLDKNILRWAMRGRLPDALVDRPKTVLGQAVANLSQHDTRIIARRRALIEAQAAALSRYIDPALAIASLESGRDADRSALAALDMLAHWLQAGGAGGALAK